MTNSDQQTDLVVASSNAPSTALDRPVPSDEDRLARAALSRVIEPGDPATLKTFADLEPLEIWELLRTKAPGLERWSSRLAKVSPEGDLARAHSAGARFVIPGDDEWPDQIEVLTEAGQQARRGGTPYGLWVRGTPNLRTLLKSSVAIVGARACSSYGENAAAELAGGLGDHGTTIVSGGAYGIDAAAHRGALASTGTTIAVLACGVDIPYPRSNESLFHRIVGEGLLVSELPPGCSPTKLRFLARNRLIAATTQGTVVVEAAIRSGALNTANWSEQCGRPVLAVPGPITSRMSEGTHLLIRERNATVATSVADILEAISPLGEHLTSYPHTPATPEDALDHDLRRTLDAVPVLRPSPSTRIANVAGLDHDTVQECLETLAQANLITYEDSGWRLSPTQRRAP
ncbi:DNA-processing protein DprA [Kribbella italica]|uniref:DNA processing protein n=1 Tax=Kribbella italica TaxID=1540520 RepID=A0A7W9J6D6_9ACTN|nr:DNA-processing protein DprA [Kribbella italica]MBB5836451.1 DNA processing protein [Kribbella italica]